VKRVIYDHRTYTCHPGTIKKQLALYEEFGWEAQTRNLGKPVVFAATETGDVNTYIHIWAYKDATDRAEKRAAMLADSGWIEYMKRSADAGFLLTQTNAILMPAPFFPTPDNAD